jgi:hypothetical protein
MVAYNEQFQGLSPKEVIAVLTNLAKISQHSGSTESDSTGTIAATLLKRLLAFCAAQHGAILLTLEARKRTSQATK